MEIFRTRFTLNGVNYRISEHVWRDNRNRRGLITFDRVRETISQPDIQHQESDIITRYWKWFPEMGSKGNYIKVVVNSGMTIHLVSTAHPDSGMRKIRSRS